MVTERLHARCKKLHRKIVTVFISHAYYILANDIKYV